MLNLRKVVVLVGLMGAGKSRIGAELAKILSLPFVDADREIEAAANCSVSDIFEQFGEMEFRRGERKVMLRLLSGKPVVLASGGGAFIQPEIRKEVKERAISVWLKASLDTLIERTSHTTHRPLLQGRDSAERLGKLMQERYPIYGEADITVVTDRQTPQDMALTIKVEIENYVEKNSR